MAVIDVGSEADNRSSFQNNAKSTFVDKHNAANDTGTLDTFAVFAVANVSGLKVGTFSVSGTSCTYRDHEDIGIVTAGSKQTFTGKNCTVSSGDYLGWLQVGGQIEQSLNSPATEIGLYEISYDAFSSGTHTLNDNTNSYKLAWSVYATGEAAAGSLPLKNVFGRPFSGVFR